MALAEPFRGQVWNVEFGFGEHPAVVLSVDALNARLGHVAVVPVTGTAGPAATHVVLTRDAGLTGRAQSYADITTLQPVDRYDLLRLRGLLAPSELRRVEDALRVHLAL